MSPLILVLQGVLFGITILVHLLKIFYLLFEPRSWTKFKSISNTHLSKGWLLLYYAVTIAFLIQTFLFLYQKK